MKSTNKTILIARVMLLILLVASMVTLASCGIFAYDWEVYSHKEFVRKVEEYNSKHNLYVDTFISFDLDSNEEVLERIYRFNAGTRKPMSKKTLYDINDESYYITQVFYLPGFKVWCMYQRNSELNNFTEQDKIEIRFGGNHFGCEGRDLYYTGSKGSELKEEDKKIYEYVYRYNIYVNDVKFGCIHISSIEEASEEKLSEIIQIMQDSLVVLNTEKYFIWRDNKWKLKA